MLVLSEQMFSASHALMDYARGANAQYVCLKE
jgi:hypothetical protein